MARARREEKSDGEGARRERFMRAALREAERGRGRTRPNPLVGAVLVRSGRIIARGHHLEAGGPHAEVVALQEAGARARGADLFVTLEPCNHFGRTPPCTEALLAAGVRRVYFGSRDPNPAVRGHGGRRLRAAGVEVTAGVLRAECDEANRQWLKFVTRGLPWVHLKAAVTLDGKLSTASGDSRWITSVPARERVHRLRDELDAVLIGIGTALADDPRLTARRPSRPSGGPARDPVRVVVDSAARLPLAARMLRRRSGAPTWVAVSRRAGAPRVQALERAGATVLRCRGAAGGRVDLRDLLRKLAARSITSVLVEGGAAVHGSFLDQGLWDELSLFVAPKLAGAAAPSWAGVRGPARMVDAAAFRLVRASAVGGDALLELRPR